MKLKNILIGVLSFLTFALYAQEEKIKVNVERESDNSVDFYYTKNVPGSYTIMINFPVLENCNNSGTVTKVVNGEGGFLFKLRPINPDEGISFSYRLRYNQGNPNPRVNDKIIYALPFKTGKSIKVIEASELKEKYFGSNSPKDFKAFIVYTNEPDTIYAMRRGIVVDIVDKYDKDLKFNKSFTSKRNSILIEHEDGTYASYIGFKKNQIFVKLGQEVYPHTPLGVLEEFNKDEYRLSFSVFYSDKNLLDDAESTMKNIVYRHKYLNPNFYVDGDKKLHSGETYTVLFNDDIKLQEFSRREKRKYKRNPDNFK